MAKLVVTLDEAAMMELQEVLLDDDEKGAMEFLKDRIASQIPEKGSSHCDSTRDNPFLIKPE